MHENHRRSFVKGISWRVFATADTICLALIFTGSIGAALSIGSIELLTKTAWYYAHERAWIFIAPPHAASRFSNALGRNAHARSALKAISWRIVGALDTFIIALVITGRLAVSSSIGGTELATKILLYYLHERLWTHIRWGLVAPGEARTMPEQSAGPVPPHETFAMRMDAVRELVDGYFHLSAAIFYGIACALSVVISACVVYLLHAAL